MQRQHKLNYFDAECVVCKKIFKANAKTAKYCSRACTGTARRKLYTCTCAECGVSFSGSQGKYCSSDCWKKALDKTRNIIRKEVSDVQTPEFKYSFECSVCGFKGFSKTGKRYTCSRSCKSKAHPLTTICKECGISFQSCGKKSLYCSINCSSKSLHKNTVIASHTCADCGTIFERKGLSPIKRCADCYKEYRWKLHVETRLLRGEEVGIGSGGNQWGSKNHQWNPHAEYHGDRGYYHGYRSVCFKVYTPCCFCCGALFSAHGTSVDIHHIDGGRDNRALENLLPLCRKCHAKVHHALDTYKTPDDYIQALTLVLPGWKEKQKIKLEDCRNKIAELSVELSTETTRTEGGEETALPGAEHRGEETIIPQEAATP